MIVTVNSCNYDGSTRKAWQCKLAAQAGTMLHFTGVFDEDVPHADLGLIKRGTITQEYYWLDRWYNVFRFDEPDGSFRNHYCNISMPPVFADGVLNYVDLDLDVVVWPDRRVVVLDETDFERNALKYGYSAIVRDEAMTALNEVKALASRHEFPFD